MEEENDGAVLVENDDQPAVVSGSEKKSGGFRNSAENSAGEEDIDASWADRFIAAEAAKEERLAANTEDNGPAVTEEGMQCVCVHSKICTCGDGGKSRVEIIADRDALNYLWQSPLT